MDGYFAPVSGESSEKRQRIDSNMPSDDEIVSDPGRRKDISEYDPRMRDDIRRKYAQMGPCRPISYTFPGTESGDRSRSFLIGWFNNREWLEYSFSKDAAFCFWCYLFGEKRAGEQEFTKKGISKLEKSK